MKIGPSSVSAQLMSVPKEPRQGAKDDAAPESGDSQVNLSDFSRTLAAMESSVGDQSIDARRVATIKEAIRNGDFQVNAQAVAQALILSVQDLLSGPAPK